MENITVRLPEALVHWADRQAELGHYANRSAAIREAVRTHKQAQDELTRQHVSTLADGGER